MELKEWKNKNLKSKGYTHFDSRTNIYKSWNYIKNPINISKHGFYPLIKKDIVFNKYNKIQGKYEKRREILYSSHIDRLILSFYNFKLNNIYNTLAEKEGMNENVIAYRDNLGKSNIEFSRIAFDFIKENNQSIILVGDFKDFFGSLNHDYLKNKTLDLMKLNRLPDDYYSIYKYVTKYAYCKIEDLLKINGLTNDRKGNKEFGKLDRALTKEKFKKVKSKILCKNKNKYGIPQGTAISALFSNIYMLDFDKEIKEYVKSLNGLYMRYSDDFIIIIPNCKFSDFEEVYKRIYKEISKIPNLKIQKDKTHIYEYKDNSIKNIDKVILEKDSITKEKDIVDYLGFTFDGKDVRFRDKTISKYYYKMYRKTKTIIFQDGKSKYGNRISNTELYKRYSIRGVQGNYKSKNKKPERIRNFISYVLRAEKVYYDEPEIHKLRKRHMSKIRKQLKKVKYKDRN
jgi:hypothetical protein